MSLAVSRAMLSQPVRFGVPPLPVRRFSVEEYCQLAETGILGEDDPVELLEGWIVAMPIRKPSHDGTISLVEEELEPLLPPGWFLRIQAGIVTADSYPYPDIAVVKGPRRQYVQRHPGPPDIAMIVEVSDTTLHEDRSIKQRIYARAGIPIYWIVDLVHRRVEVWSNPVRLANEPAYQNRKTYGLRTAVPVLVAGRQCGQIPVKNLFPQ
jgi:Uma2 family endonuclease